MKEKNRIHPTAALFARLAGFWGGKRLFTFVVCQKAPYFGSLGATIDELKAGRAVVLLPKRRRVQNHIGTVHAIAMANACELAAGTMTEVSLPPGMRWLPRGMTIQYLKKAETDLRAVSWLSSPIRAGEACDVVVPVDVIDTSGETVVHADITMYVSPRRANPGVSPI